jgi:hypothetical protein
MMSRLGRGRAVREIFAASGAQDANLMQKAFYNGYYKYHGAKVQHVYKQMGWCIVSHAQYATMMLLFLVLWQCF